MFYSHEILTNSRYGVATVWLVATFGVKSPSKKVTKKAIQEVNVQKACETIIEPPGAPIALRLQGSLLYGVSRVYSQQYGYLLTDTEKIQAHMRAFYGVMHDNAIDPMAGKAKRDQLILLDDPSFVLETRLPDFEFDKDGNIVLPDLLSQLSRKTSSQLSPFATGHSSVLHDAPLIDLQFRRSSSIAGNLNLPSPFGGSANAQKPGDEFLPMVLGEEELLLGDFGLAIDADGNVIEEPDLPPHRPLQPEAGSASGAIKGSQAIQPEEEGAIIFDADGDVQMKTGEQALPDAEAFPARKQKYGQDLEDEPSSPLRPRKRSVAKMKVQDEHTRISRDEFKSWSDKYSAIQDLARSHRPAVGPAQARRNAFLLTFGLGIGNIGAPTGIPGYVHPLADTFAGPALQASILGTPVGEDNEDEYDFPQGRRRPASVAFEDEEGDERRVRSRVNDGSAQQVGGQFDGQGDVQVAFDNQEQEVGREPGSILSDMAAVPWNRPSSLVPSSARSKHSGRALSGQAIFEGSPLVSRGSILPAIERHSDNAQPALGSDAGFGPIGGADSSMGEVFPGVGAQDTSQVMREALDREGNNFLTYVEGITREKGDDRFDEADEGRCWVEFDDLFKKQDRTRHVVAQAFYHALALATKSAIRVEQDGQHEGIPFGTIRLGVNVEIQDLAEDDGALQDDEVHEDEDIEE
ncbi:Meiotic recombination protein rec8 [Pleurostoma richardsiae]|uniref:Meiotic recombination protein rec8 n=1 Tax=Pleurostoma richardsiae TaxID=41990 RepID=A0AA38S3M7_9PEZI|nr:Meiotic recombination protein rec8 [Pleurostoma richardsiae]